MKREMSWCDSASHAPAVSSQSRRAPVGACETYTVANNHDCYAHVSWGQRTGIGQNPEWYPDHSSPCSDGSCAGNLTARSMFEEFQVKTPTIPYIYGVLRSVRF